MIDKTFKTLVYCRTYNQSGFISNAMDGFVSQKTDFPFVCAIFDDASTDGERSVISDFFNQFFDKADTDNHFETETDYAHVSYGRHKTNRECHFLIFLLKENHYSKKKTVWPYLDQFVKDSDFIAWCEGDDYWIDSKKLQKQVDFLENNRDFSLCFSNAKILNVNNLPCSFDAGHVENRAYLPDEFFKKWLVPTASVIYRKEVDDVHLIKPERLMFGDIILLLKAAKIGKIRGMSDVMTVYRLNSGSVTQNPDNEYKLIMRRPEFVEFIIDNFGDILDKKYLYKGLCKRYCYRSLVQPTLDAKYNDLLAASKINKVITLKFVFRNIVLMGFRAMFKIIRGR